MKTEIRPKRISSDSDSPSDSPFEFPDPEPFKSHRKEIEDAADLDLGL
jgi:hypothetical protein